ncbi:hypothetical protein FRB93_007924 [Tulasnella sp. JGI-2019a]|nr:hypothetical protein FRB93_007924 [Tulasnella sp. JGI-2019a]
MGLTPSRQSMCEWGAGLEPSIARTKSPLLEGDEPNVSHIDGLRLFDLLPAELLAYIISLSAQMTNPTQLATQLDRDTVFPFTALRVCKRWRDITNGTSSLWNTAAIISRPHWIPRLMRHAQHRNGLPMDLSVCLDVRRNRHFLLDFDRRLKSTPTRPTFRIRNMRIICQRDMLYGSISQGHGLMDELKRSGAVIEELDWIAVSDEERFINPHNWSFITRSLVGTFAQLSQLRSLLLSGVRFYMRQDVIISTVEEGLRVLPALERLILEDCDVFTLDILRYAEMPKLHTLSISCSDAPNPDPTAPSMAMTTGIAHLTSVQHLTLKSIPTSQDLVNVLSSAPNTRRLTLGGRWTLEPLETGMDGVLDHLEYLRVLNSSIQPDALRDVKRAVLARFGTLREVALGYNAEEDQGTMGVECEAYTDCS